MTGGYGRLYNWWCTQPQQESVKYGYLYNWYACVDINGIASNGWEVPNNDKWDTLSTYLGGNTISGGKLKETGLTYWNTPNLGATNEVGFNAVGGGLRLSSGTYGDLNVDEIFWTSDSYDSVYAWIRSVAYDRATLFNGADNKKNGYALRLVKTVTTLTDGQSGTYTGNDGRIYPTICIGTQEWLAVNLAETLYRNGTGIPKITNNTGWAALTTGAICAYSNDETNVFKSVNIAPAGWHIPSAEEWNILRTFLVSNRGGKLKEVGLKYWLPPNTGATNEYGFNARGSSYRNADGTFSFLLNTVSAYASTTVINVDQYIIKQCKYEDGDFYQSNPKFQTGVSIRPIKDDSTWTAGDTVTDADGNVYPTVKIGNQVWTASNWKCAKYNDGSPIPNVVDNISWAALTTGAQCVYDNNLENL